VYNRSLITEEPTQYHRKKKRMEKRMKKNNAHMTKSTHLITKSVLYTTTFLLLAVCFLPLASSNTPTPSIHLPDRPVTMIAYDGAGSYFDIDLSDVPPDLDLANGDYQGWCADRSVVMPRGEQLTVRLYNSYDHSLPLPLREKNWSKVNYILNHNNSATKLDIQDAVWYLLCNYPYSSLTSKAQMLVDTAQDGFIPESGELIAILAEPIRNASNPWPFQFSFIQVRLPKQELTEPEEPEQPNEPIQTTTTVSHGYRYNDIAPTADTNGPYTGYAKETIEFSGTTSVDPDGIIILYKWSFGDGATAEGTTATHTYSHAGVYHISLKVTDNFGLSDTDVTNATITIRNSPPTNPFISGPTNGTTNTNYSYAFGSSDQDHDGITYRIDWGDGTTIETATLPSGQYFALSHRWNTPGTYTITVTASDGSLVAVSEQDVIIKELPLADNIYIVGLALLAIIALLAILLYSKKAKNKK
jgi:hypothetical protein